MNSLERVIAAATFSAVDATPVIAQVGGHAALCAGYTLNEYLKSGEIAADSQIKALQKYGYDAVIAIFDACVEAEAAGCEIKFRDGFYPIVSKPVVSKMDISRLELPDPKKAGRMPQILKEIEILRDRVGEYTPVVGAVIGPMTIATQLAGLENSMFAAADEPEAFEALLDFACDAAMSFAKAQLEAGAHISLIFDPSASPVVVPSSFYREIILPRHKKLFKSLKDNGSAANWLHIAGPVASIMPYYKEAGVTLANFDYLVDPLEAQRLLPDICLDGNLKPMSFVTATPQSVYDSAREVISKFEKRGGFILSSGCEIPPEANPKTIEAMVAAARGEKCPF